MSVDRTAALALLAAVAPWCGARGIGLCAVPLPSPAGDLLVGGPTAYLAQFEGSCLSLADLAGMSSCELWVLYGYLARLELWRPPPRYLVGQAAAWLRAATHWSADSGTALLRGGAQPGDLFVFGAWEHVEVIESIDGTGDTWTWTGVGGGRGPHGAALGRELHQVDGITDRVVAPYAGPPRLLTACVDLDAM